MLVNLVVLATGLVGMNGLQRSAFRGCQVHMGADFINEVWNIDNKKKVWELYDPNAQRTYENFNPFERDDQGNACDPNGKFPGEVAYKDPKRPDTSWEIMQKERVLMEEIMKIAFTKPGDVPGAPGRWKTGWADKLGAVP